MGNSSKLEVFFWFWVFWSWNAEDRRSSAFQCTTYYSTFWVDFKCEHFILHFTQHFHLGSGRGCLQHLESESYPPGINVYRHVYIMSVPRTYNAIVHMRYRHGRDMYICLENNVHGHTFLKKYKLVCIWYVHGMYIQRYKHVRTYFRRACLCIYMYICVLNHINMYIQCTNLYILVCVADIQCQCTDGYIHFMKCSGIVEVCTYTDISFWLQLFFSPPGWPVGCDWLLPGVAPIQVQAHEFDLHLP
jgi:hypothetical protein